MITELLFLLKSFCAFWAVMGFIVVVWFLIDQTLRKQDQPKRRKRYYVLDEEELREISDENSR